MTYKKKLVEVALPLAVISEAAAHEAAIKRGKPSQIHKWWARRPGAATRAVIWAALVDDPSAHPDLFPSELEQQVERDRLFGILERLVQWDLSADETILAEARDEILKSFDGHLPTIADPFAGGGGIPLESLRLGLPTESSDLNPVAVLIQRATTEIPARFKNLPPVHPEANRSLLTWKGSQGLAADLRAYGDEVFTRAASILADQYPAPFDSEGQALSPIAWVWARTVRSPDPAWPAHVPLVRSWVLAKKPRRPVVWVQPSVNRESLTVRYEIAFGGVPDDGTVDRGNGVCIATGSPIPVGYIRDEARAGRLGQELIAVVCAGDRQRTYVSPESAGAQPPSTSASWKPDTKLPDGGLGFRVQNYGLDQW